MNPDRDEESVVTNISKKLHIWYLSPVYVCWLVTARGWHSASAISRFLYWQNFRFILPTPRPRVLIEYETGCLHLFLWDCHWLSAVPRWKYSLMLLTAYLAWEIFFIKEKIKTSCAHVNKVKNLIFIIYEHLTAARSTLTCSYHKIKPRKLMKNNLELCVQALWIPEKCCMKWKEIFSVFF